MKLRSRRALPAALILAVGTFTAACTDNGREPVLSQVDTVPPAPSGPQSNQNIDNPTLTVAENFPVSPGDTLTLVWSDEFDGASLDPETWFFATGDGTEAGLPGGWGNNELQYYLPDNAQVEDGVLKITARLESVGGQNYTSARINTEDRFAFKYGRIEASIKLPSGQGLWPAFWMLAQDSPYGTWAASGEIDIVEAVNLDGSNGNEIFATIHYGGEFPANQSSSVTYVPGPDVTEDFHAYAVEWDETEIRWYFDDSLYAVQTNWSSTAAPYPAPFDQPFYILLNLAVGGNFPGFAIDTGVLPATMEVDWVRVYSGEDASVPADPGITPEAVVFATDPNVTEDLAPPGVDNFGSGAVFDFAFAGDADYNPAIQAISGEGYGAGVHVAFVAFTNYAAGFASTYGNFVFKVKGDPVNLASFEVKFIGGTDTSVLYDIPNYAGSADLGNGWYQVSIPMSDFAANIAVNNGFLLGPAGGQPAPFSFLMTDIGFTGTAGGGGGGGGGGGTGAVVNGDFETGDLTGWDVFENGGTITPDNTQNNGGSWSVHVVAGAGNNPVLKQSFLFPDVVAPGNIVNVSFDMKGTAADGGVIFPELISEGAGGAATGQLLDTIAAPTADWTTYSYTPAAGADVTLGVTFQLAVVCGGVPTCSADVFIDNVSVTLNGGGG